MIHQYIFNLYNITGSFDPFKILEHSNIRLKYVPFKDKPLGQYIKMLEQPYILLSEDLRESPKRYFVLSHELFHALKHNDLVGYYSLNERSNDRLEYEANKFAVILCMHLYKESYDYNLVTTEQIQRQYGIPQSLVYMIEHNQKYINF